jgi:astacin
MTASSTLFVVFSSLLLVELVAGYKYDLIQGDIQVPKGSRHNFKGLTGWGGTALWPGGRVPYSINTASGMAADDARILGAISHWQSKTCIRFVQRTNEANYVLFTKAEGTCNSPVGRQDGTYNEINLADQCELGAVIHEIGHSLGFLHEQSRQDRDDFVAIDTAQIQSSAAYNFDKDVGRDLLPYEYSSIMHYGPYDFAVGAQPTIISPQPIGQRVALHDSEAAAINFMYQNCAANPPLQCVASRDQNAELTIATGKKFLVQFTAMYGSLGPDQIQASASKPSGATVGASTSGFVIGKDQLISWTPSSGDVGTHTLSTTFSANGQSATCQVHVKVVDANVCFGKAATDPTVCNGHGTCTSDSLHPCQCASGYGGVQCEGTSTCPRSYGWHFDDDQEVISFLGNARLQTSVAARGAGSLQVNNQAQFRLLNPGAPLKITYYLRGPMSGNSPWMSFRLGTTSCFDFGISNGRWYSKGATINGAAPSADTWYFIDMRPDFGSNRFDIYVDNNLVGSQVPFANQCNAVDLLIVFANLGKDSDASSYLDEMTFYCTDAGPTGSSAPAPYVPNTPPPPTSCMDTCVARGCRTSSVSTSNGQPVCNCGSCGDTSTSYCAGTVKCDYPANSCSNIGGQPKCLTVQQTSAGPKWSNWQDCQKCPN